MPSFLNKVFGYKRHDDKEASRTSHEASDGTLLDGKYEAVAPIVSPTASTFIEALQAKSDAGFSLFRPKGRGSSHKSAQKPEVFPHLTLRLPGHKENLDSRPFGVFEADPDSQILLDDTVIAEKRLNPLEALILIRACTQAIAERGLETLGIMHPHWFSASPEVQRKLISLFIRSLSPNQTTTLPSTPTSSTSTFENELQYTRSPHDVAAVLRWGLRHLSLESGHFGKDSAGWGWYNTFFEGEHNGSYPPKAFSELLLPQLPTSHVELLTTTLGLISLLASHAEANSISGSKLSKFLGLWLLVTSRAEESDDWRKFYARWERSGRILEHLFLARLREESVGQRLPTRLQELIQSYPYKGSPAMDDGLLSRPRFSTRQYDALFVRVETLLTRSAKRPKQHPIQLLLQAFQLPIVNPSCDEHMALWNTLKTAVAPEDPEGPQFTRIFADETIHLLSLIPAADNNLSILSTPLTSPIAKVFSRKRSSSPIKASNTNNGSTLASPPVSPTSPSSIVVTDWAQFSLSGFGDTPTTQPLSALLSEDDDIEVTQPRVSRKPSHRGKSRTRRRRSDDHEPLDNPPSSQPDLESSIIETKLASVHVVHIDEAFIDFWSDAIVDPISANWPSFVVCGLKPVASSEQPIRWLVIEQAYSDQESSRVPSPDGRRGRSPRPSFKSDISGFRINSVFASARKRLSMFSKSATDLDLKKSSGKTSIAGELGEVLVEEEPTFPSASLIDTGLHADRNEAVRPSANSDMAPDATDQLAASEISTVPIAGVPSTAILKDGSDPVQAAALAAPSIEPTSQSEGGCNGSSVLPHSSVRASEETISVDSARTIDVNSKVDSSTNVVIAPLTTDTPHSCSIQGTHDPTFLDSGPMRSVVVGIVQNVRQEIAIEPRDQPIEPAAQMTDRDEDAESAREPSGLDAVQLNVADSGSREDTQPIAMPLVPETIALVAATPIAQPTVIAVIHDKASVCAGGEPPKASADLEIDDLSPLSSTAIVTETGAQPEPHSRTSVAGEEAQGGPEHVDIPTPGQEVSAGACAPAGVVGPLAAELEALDSAAPQRMIFNGAVSQPVVAELQATSQIEVSSVPHPGEEAFGDAIHTSAEVGAAEIESAANQVPELAAQIHVQDTIVHTSDALLIEAISAAKVEADVSAGTVFASQAEDVAAAEVEAQSAPEGFVHHEETQDIATPAPVLEHAAVVDETLGPANIAPEPEQAEAETQDPVNEAVVDAGDLPIILAEEAQSSSGAELPSQAVAGALSNRSDRESATAALDTQEEIVAVAAEAKSTPDVPVENAQVCASSPNSAPVEDAVEVTAAEAGESVPSLAVEPGGEAPQILVDATPIASEPVAITSIVPIEVPVEQAPIEIDRASSASASQLVDDAAAVPAVAVPEEIVTTQAEAQAEYRAAATVDESLVVEDAEPAPELNVPVDVIARQPETIAEPEVVAEANESSLVEPEESAVEVLGGVDAGQPEIGGFTTVDENAVGMAAEVDVSTHESAGL